MRFLDAAAVAALGPAAAARAVTDALRGGLDPAADPARTAVGVGQGQFLLMPSAAAWTPAGAAGTPAGAVGTAAGAAAGVKVATVAPGNPARGLPRIHAVYLLFDPETLAPRAVLDGTALTTLRTPAVSVAAVEARLPQRPLRIVLVGAGPQARGHAAALASVRPVERAVHLVRDLRTAPPGARPGDVMTLGTAGAEEVLRSADVVVCATSARTPVFDSALLRDDVVVVAVGSHEPDARELDAALLARATVVVEDAATALREAGDVVLAVAEGALAAERLVRLPDVVTGTVTPPTDRPLVFKSVGMAWEDLVVATAVAAARPA